MDYRTIMHPNGRLEKIPLGSLPLPAESLDLSTLTDDDLRRDCRESLVMMIRNSQGDLKALGAVRELLDRLEGKPVQRILEKTQSADKPRNITVSFVEP